MRKNSTNKRSSVSRIESLEPRVLYSADLLSGTVDPGDDWNNSNLELDEVLSAITNSQFADNSLNSSSIDQNDYSSYEIVFIGSGIADIDTLIADMQQSDPSRHLEIVMLDSSESAIEQISNVLAERSELDAIHLFAHGEEGSINFGNDSLELDTLAAQRETLSSWSNALTDDADLLIYGCNLAGSEDGIELVEQLALLTGADVAASDDLTGAEELGGDWDLEITTGSIEVNMVISEATRQEWTATLATFTVINLDATGVGSLDWAITSSNQRGSLDTIEFAVSGTIFATAGYVITDEVIILGSTAPGYTDAPTVSIDGSGAGIDVGITITGANGTVLEGLNIHSFDSGLVLVNSTGVVLNDNYLGTNLAGTALGGTGISGHVISVTNGKHDGVITGNVISGGNSGINVSGADRTIIQGNFIGTDATGSVSIGNINGIVLENDSKLSLIGTDGDLINDLAERNVISGNFADGIRITGNASDGTTIAGNFIGTDATGTAILRNGDDGIVVTDNGSNVSILDNVISGNVGEGIVYSTTGNGGVIQGNFIGTDLTGTEQLGNLSAGIYISSNADNLLIGGLAAGEGNTIANNGITLTLGGTLGGGITLDPTAKDKVEISGNTFYANHGLAIDLNRDGPTPNDSGDGDGGPNKLQNSPELLGITTDGAGNVSLSGDGFDLAGGTYTIQVYASSMHDNWRGEGGRLLFTDTISNGSAFVVNAAGVPLTVGEYVSAILIDSNGNTSEFSEVVVATSLSGNSAPTDITASGSPQGSVSLNEDGGDAGYLFADSGDAIFNGLTAFTIEARIAFTDTSSAHTLLSYDAVGEFEDLRITLAASGNLEIVTGDISVTTSGFDFHTLAGTDPHTLSIAWDSSGALNVYADGELKFSTTGFATGVILAGGGQLVIGQDQNGLNIIDDPAEAFNGNIYELRIFDTAQTAGDIADRYVTTLAFDTPNLVAAWSFEDFTGNGVVTDVVNGNNLNAAVRTGAGWTASTPELVMSVFEDTVVGALVGEVFGTDSDREAEIAALLAANSNLVYSAETDKFYEVISLGDWTVAEGAATSQLLDGVAGQLVVIESAHENGVVVDALNRVGILGAWIGASDITSENEWFWRTSGADDTQFWSGDFTGNSVNEQFYSWEPTDPNGGASGDFAVIETDGTWRDRDDTSVSMAVVEWDANAVLDTVEALTYTFVPGGDAGGAFAIDASTGVITVADPSLIDYETSATMTVTVRVTDDSLTSYDESFDIEILNADGDAGISLPVAQSGDEDVGIVFSTANSNAVTVNSGGPYDPAMTATLSVVNGTLTLATLTGVTFVDGTNNGESTITIFGNESDLNAALDGLSYIPDSNYFGGDTLSVTTGSAAPNLVGDYGFENGSLLDESGSGNDATSVGGSADPSPHTDGERGESLSFDGDDRIEIAGRFGDPAQLTLAAWVNLDAGQSDNVVMSLGDEVVLTLDTAAGVGLRVGSTGLSGFANVAGTGWHHVAATYDNVTGALAIYVDGVLANSVNITPGSADWAGASQANSAIGSSFGTDIFNDNPMVGDIDGARVYDRVLTASEIAFMAGHQGVANESVALTVNPVNDEQTLDVNLGETVIEGSSVAITASVLDSNDIDNTPVQIVYTVATIPTNGQLELTSAPDVAITSFTQADIDAGLLIFVHDGSETTSDSFDFTVDDGQGTTSSGTFSLTVTPVNDEQTLDVNLGATVNEDSSVSITAAVLDTNDADNTPVQIVYTVTTIPTNGQLELTSTPNAAITSFTQADIDAGLLIFVHDGSETTSDSFDFTVDDGQGATSNGTFSLTVTPVNDEQTLDVNLGATVDEGNDVAITAAVLDTNDVDNTPTQIVYTVTTIPVNGQLELTTAPNVAITSFTQADIDAGLLIFVHDGSETTSDSFDFTVDDGQGATSSGTFSLTVTPVNDEQTLDVNLGETVDEGSTVAITAAVLDTNDTDNTPTQIVYTVTTIPVNGQLELTTAPNVAITSFTQADIDAGLLIFVHDGSETTSDSFDFTVNDGQGATSSGTFNLTITPVNDEQTLDVNLGETVSEGSSVSITAAVLDTNDVDNTPTQIVYTVTTAPANGQLELTTTPNVAITSFTQADIDAGLLIFVHNGSETMSDSFDFTVDDGQGTTSSGTFSLTVTPVNDEQTLDVNLGETVNEGSSVAITAAVLDTNDVDNTPVQIVYTVTTIPTNGQLELTSTPDVAITSFTQADIDGGLLIFVHDGSETTSDSFDFTVDDGQGTTSSGTFSLAVTPVNDEQTLDVNLGETVSEGSSVVITAAVLDTNDVDNTPVQIVYTVTTIPTNGQLELTSTPNAAITSFTQADIDAGLLIFVHDGSETTSDSFDFTVDDGQGATTSGTFNLTVTPVNDEQTLDVNLGATVDEGNSVSITAAVLDTNDSDNTPTQVVYTVTTSPTNGQLELTTTPDVAITSFTQADIDGGLLIFVHDGSETTSDSFDFTVDDGQGATSSGTFSLTVTPVNDEQTLDVNLGATVDEDNSVVITAAVLGTNDADNTPAQIVYTVTTIPANGQLELTTTPNAAITSFTQADIDAGLLIFVHDGSETTSDSFDFTVDDGQGSISSGTFSLTVTPVNDEQTLDVNLGATVDEDSSVVITAAVLDTNDADNTPVQIVYTVTTIPTNGQLELTSTPNAAITSFTQADIDAGLLIFVHNGSETTSDSFDFTVDDGQGTTSSGTFSLTVTPVNDEQTLDVNLGQTVSEGSNVAITSAVLDTNDSDNTPAQIVYTVTTIPANGQLELTTTPNAAITSFTQADIDAGLLIFVHDGSETTSDSFDFTVDDGQGATSSGTFALTVTPVNNEQTLDVNLGEMVNEGGNVAITSAVLDTNDSDNTPAQIVYTVTTIPANGQLELTTTPNAPITSFTQADIDAGLLIFVHNGSETTSDSFDFTVDDGQGVTTSGTFNLTVTPVNDEQTLDVNLGETVSEGSSVAITAAVLDTNDVDNTPAQIVYTVTTVPVNGQLELTTTPNTPITSFTQADIDAGLLIFVHNGSETTSDSFDFTVDDGQGTTSSGTFSLTVTPVNDEQTLDVNLGETVSEGSNVSITAAVLETNDSDNTPIQIVYTVTSIPLNGQLELTTTPNAPITSFTQADIDAGLLIFVHNGSETTSDSFDFTVDDGQGTTSSGAFALTVTPVNDEQTLDVNLGETVSEGSSVSITAAVLDTNDVDNTPAQIVYTVTTIPANGQLELTTTPNVAITSFTQADIDAGLLIFVHNGSEATSDSFGFTVDDGQGTTSSGTFALTITPVNDEQTLDVNLGETVSEGSSVSITAAVLDTNDVDNTPAQIVYTVTTIPANGQLELTTTPNAAITSFTQADIDAGLLIFVHNGSETTSDSFDFTVDDGQGATSSGTFALTVTPVNDEQTLDVNLGETVSEGSSVSITAAVLDTNDVDNTPAQIVYTVTAIPANGQLELTTTPNVAVTSFNQADIDAGLLIFVHNGSETTSDSFDFTVDDGQGTTSSGTFSLTVTPVNDEQTLDVNLGDTVSEGSSVSITAAVLDTNDSDNTPIQIVYTVTSIPLNGQLELTTTPNTAIMSFTQADIDAGLLIFVHNGSETTSDSFDFTVDDGQGATSTGTFALTVTPVNDEQTLDVNLGETVNEGGNVAIASAVLDTNDSDNTPAQIVYTVTTIPANGQLELTTTPNVAITSFTQADIDAGLLIFVHNGSETTSDSFDFTVDDGQGTISSGTFALTVTPVNDEQTLDVNLGETVSEGGSVAITAAVLDTNDVDNTPSQIVYTVTTVSANGQLELTTAPNVAVTSFTQADIDAGLLIFVHNGSETTSDSFDFTVDDGQGTISSGTFGLTVTPVNDEQTLDVNIGESVSEGGSVAITSAVLDTNDTDNTPTQIVYSVTTPPANGQLELTTSPGIAVTSFTQADIDGGLLIFVHDGSNTTSDSFNFNVDDGQGTTSSGTFGLTVTSVNDEQTLDVNLGETVDEGGNVAITSAVLDTNDTDNTPFQIVYTVTTIPANGQLELTTSQGIAITSFTQADIDGGLLIFVHDGSETTSDAFNFVVDDGQGTTSNGTFSLTVTPVNDEQTLDVNLGETVSEGGSVAITSAVLDTNDTDNTPTQIVYAITSLPANGQLELTTSPGVAVTGFTQADINSGLLIFVHDGSDTTSDTFQFTVNDGQGIASTGVFNLTISPVNDEQMLNVNLGVLVAEGGQTSITSAELSSSDVDNTSDELVYNVTSTSVNGYLELTTNAGVAISNFTQADIDAGRLVYVHDGSETASDSFTFTVDDGEGMLTSGVFAITVSPVNDEQTLIFNVGASVDEGGLVQLTASQLSTSDVDNTSSEVVYLVSDSVSHGQLELTSSPGVAITSFSQADINAGLVVFVHDGSDTVSDSFTFVVDDGQGVTDTGTFDFAIVPVNDEQQLVTAGNIVVIEGGFSQVTVSALASSDSDNSTSEITYSILSAPVTGQFAFSGAPDIAISLFTQADIDSGNVVFVHNGSEASGEQIGFELDDGIGAVTQSSINIVVTAVNDAPSIELPIDSPTAIEQTTLELHGRGLQILDVDAGTSILTVSLSVTEGALTVTPSPLDAGLLGLNQIIGSGSSTVTLTGTLDAINGTLDGIDGARIDYINDSDTPPNQISLSVVVDDHNNGGLPSAEGTQSSENLPILIQAVDDSPVIVSNQGATSVLLTQAENSSFVAQLSASDIDTIDVDLSYSIAGGEDAARFVVNQNGQVSFVSAPRYDLPVDSNSDNSYHVTVAVSDGSTSTTQELVISVLKSTVFQSADTTPVSTSNEFTPVESVETEQESVSAIDDAELTEVVVPVNQSPTEASETENSLRDLAPPSSIVVDDSVVNSISPSQTNDEPTKLESDSSNNLIRKLLLAGTQGPAKISIDLTTAIYQNSFGNADFLQGLDRMRDQLDETIGNEMQGSEIISSVAVGASATLTVGFIGWLLRAGSLLAGLLSSAPLWKQFDPITLFAKRKKKNPENESEEIPTNEDRKLDHLFRRGSGGKT